MMEYNYAQQNTTEHRIVHGVALDVVPELDRLAREGWAVHTFTTALGSYFAVLLTRSVPFRRDEVEI